MRQRIRKKIGRSYVVSKNETHTRRSFRLEKHKNTTEYGTTPRCSFVGPSTMNEQQQQQQEEGEEQKASLVAHTLLASAKDARYVEQGRRLLLQIFLPLSSTAADNSVLPEALATLASSLLYACTVLRRQRRTAGMEHVGIEYDAALSSRRLTAGAILAAVWIFGVQWCWVAVQKRRTTSTGSSSSSEQLTGALRRRVFEEQRQTMMRRAEATANNNNNIETTTDIAPAPSSTRTTQHSLSSLFETAINSLSSALSATPEGPHEIVSSSHSNHSNATRSVASWVLRLHLALYCLNGRFPTILHRILYWKPLQQEASFKTDSNNATPRIVGLLILAQAAGTALNTVSRALIRKWVDSRASIAPSSNARNIRFEGLASSSSSTPQQQCAICRQPRQYPACSIHCGHVFCWNCLQQWVVTNVAACPLCRKPCAANEIVLLHGYYQSGSSSSEAG